MPRMFGTDGVRGVANTPDLSPELAFALGRAAAAVARERTGRRPVAVVGRDTRRSGPMLAAAISAGVCSAGGDVVDLGVVTTPGVAFVTTHLGADFGVMISASHNPAPDNGIKFFSADGFKLPDAAEDELEALVRASTDALPRPTGAELGTIRTSEAAVEAYVQHLVSTGSPLSGMRVVVDCGHGAAYRLAPEVLRRLGAEVIALNTAPDGMNINDGCGSTHPEALQQAVLAHGAQAGIAHDGDADRCIAVDERGELVDGDQIMAVCALDLKARGQLPADTLVATVMSNMGLELLLREHGVRLLRTKVGDRYVLEEMQKGGYALGGEQSGHVIFRELSTTGDGILTAVQLLSVCVRARQPLSALAGRMQRLPQWLENVRVGRKEGWESNPAIRAAIAQAEAALEGQGRVLVRASGTEPLIRVMLEGADMAQLRSLAAAIGEVIRAELQ
ncbi:phosphoglucosamine mutase [Symbiobacterium terraclitae]|uniref:Phosphoglucosamine mutase n=1 Tax=Symbiobacterium terraclitae TaxID=557451 RepID=A0ABS4JR85_9FIRM|nr:phosphoglucosamine mutase [Symbiobacterium terraclitae]MBP2018044.1 phosphoglucosamine mutase [Symbiobacterium terraclitae]